MTFKMTPAADGLSATLGVGASDALKIDDAAKTVSCEPLYSFLLRDYANDAAAAAGGIAIGGLYRTGATPKCRVT